jgi:hypothetical protein
MLIRPRYCGLPRPHRQSQARAKFAAFVLLLTLGIVQEKTSVCWSRTDVHQDAPAVFQVRFV